ncbi:transmembrane protein 65 isoform X1 [Tympanuchus pallidicinctus]|uniref:transmembrane protein 65 isoform X1 n=1 Tax=Tympanuchus pallidicinctus TaxID=109042 RepID=UPI0022876EF2|nr:transmembrane protein 65 isoform X1 [Tympanuchus pallidicinctus]
MSAWLGRAALLLGRPGGPAAPSSSSSRLGSLRGPPRCCCRRRLGSLRGGADGLLPARGAPPGRALGTHPKKEPMEALNTAQGARDFIYSLHSTERSCLLRELHRFESIAIAQGCSRCSNAIGLQSTESGFLICSADPIAARASCQQYGETRANQESSGACSSAHSQAYHPKEAVPPSNCPSTKYDRTHYLWPPLMAEAAGKPCRCPHCCAEGWSSEKLEVAPPSPGQLRHVFFHNALPFVGFGFLDNAIMIAAGTQIELSIGVVLGISTMAAAALGNLVSDLAGLGLAGYVEALASRLGLSIPDLTPKQADMWQTRLSAHLGKAIGVTIGCILGMFPLLFFGDEEEKLEEKN